MATNYVQFGRIIKLPVTSGSQAGDWNMVSDLAVVLTKDADDDDQAMCSLEGVFTLSVTGEDNAGNQAVAVGDKVYADGTALNVDATDGTLFGHALAAVAAGETAEIPVRLKQ